MKTFNKLIFALILAAHIMAACQRTTDDPKPDFPESLLTDNEAEF